MAPSTSQSGVCFGSVMISEYASTMDLWRLLNCLIQKLGSLSGPGHAYIYNPTFGIGYYLILMVLVLNNSVIVLLVL